MAQTELLTPGEAGAVLGVSGETMRRWANAKKIRHVRLPNGQVRFHPEDVEAHLQPVERTEATA